MIYIVRRRVLQKSIAVILHCSAGIGLHSCIGILHGAAGILRRSSFCTCLGLCSCLCSNGCVASCCIASTLHSCIVLHCIALRSHYFNSTDVVHVWTEHGSY